MAARLDFFIAGVQKGGTTALWSFLKQHPEVELSAEKETHFFDAEQLDWSKPDYDLLHARFDWQRAGVVRGEATPVYTYWLPSLSRIHAYNPHAKFIVIFRHPSHRAFSAWRMVSKRGEDPASFEYAISDEGRQRVANSPGGLHRYFSYVERGFYAEQVERLLDLFPRRSLLFLKTDDLWRQPGSVLAEVEQFLGIEAKLAATVESRYVVPVDSRELGAIPIAAQVRLDRLYRANIERTSRLTGLDFSDWLDPSYVEPVSAGART